MEPIKRVKNDIDFDKVEESLLSLKTQLVLRWFMKSKDNIQSIIAYDWSDDVGLMDNASDTEKAQSLADWIVRNRADLTLTNRRDEKLSKMKLSPEARKRYYSILWKAYVVAVIADVLLYFIFRHYFSIYLEQGIKFLVLVVPFWLVYPFLLYKKVKIVSEELKKNDV